MMSSGKIEKFFFDKGYGFIKGDDGKKYFVHIRKVHGGITPNEGDRVSFEGKQGEKGLEAHSVRITVKATGTPSSGVSAMRGNSFAGTDSGGAFAYGFVRRKAGKAAPTAFHHRQEQGHLDIAFDVDWTTETPTALQPCEDPSVQESAVQKKGENIGYNKRWLMIDGQPAISPFTVKGAVANGVANLLGGCFRVPDREEGHNKALNAGTYPYTGVWKRYRVSMNAKSLPGIISEINCATGYVRVQPVIEYYWDSPTLPLPLRPGDSCHAEWTVDRRRNIIKNLATQGGRGHNQGSVAYFGPYRFGMDLHLQPGDMGKHHHHRFYSLRGMELDGQVSLLSLAPEKSLLEKVYGGQYCKGEEKELKAQRMRHHLGKPWYENLRDLKPGDWCYYTLFEDAKGQPKISSIGKNFQFKALFNHQQVLPSGNETCTDPGNLCPRCALFGLADKSDGSGKAAVGYAGRFRAATLISTIKVTSQSPIQSEIPRVEKQGERFLTGTLPISLHSFSDGRKDVIRQFVLPIMGPPKPSKRDVNGYFDEMTGAVKGAKRYHHVELDFENTLPALVKQTDGNIKTDEGMPYAHQMRPVASVCREKVTFSGTIGAENCSTEEIAALLALLDRRFADHAFKLGLGKNIGLGSVSSRINKVWIRHPGQAWRKIDVPAEDSRKELVGALKDALPEALGVLRDILSNRQAAAKLHPLKDAKKRLRFAKAGLYYWKEAKVETV